MIENQAEDSKDIKSTEAVSTTESGLLIKIVFSLMP